MQYPITPDELAQLEALKKEVLQKVLTKEARERLGRVKVVKPELASQIELYLLQLYQAGQIKGIITDEKLKMMLEQLASGKKFKIIR
nr:DNA-binding protein [Candidatus Aenigmarchaeota archaeon]